MTDASHLEPEPTAVISPDSWTRELPAERLFERRQPLEVDIGCGKGRFLLARAAAAPTVDFLGIDRMLGRIRKLDRKILRAGLRNVRLLRIEASYALQRLLPPSSVSGFYIFFPDPWPKRRHHRRRLFGDVFVEALDRTLVPDGFVHVATDHLDYFKEVRERMRGDSRFEEIPAFEPSEEERTDFEVEFLRQNAPIGRCSFRKAPAPPVTRPRRSP
jgi:tRNA (guanine-N7-)-methyltransferase